MAFWCIQATLADSFLADLEDLSDDENHDEVFFFLKVSCYNVSVCLIILARKNIAWVFNARLCVCNVLDISAFVHNWSDDSAVTHCPLNIHIHEFCVDDSLIIWFTNLER